MKRSYQEKFMITAREKKENKWYQSRVLHVRTFQMILSRKPLSKVFTQSVIFHCQDRTNNVVNILNFSFYLLLAKALI